jgi:3-oxoacyl-[acyl-carrier protein] reductase
MDLGLAGKVALVGGASQGIGRGIATSLAREGATVAIYALDDEHLVAARQELEQSFGRPVLALPCDLRRAEDCARVVEQTVTELGGLDVLVPNAASGHYHGDILGESDAGWAEELDLYTGSTIRLCRAAVPHLRARGGGAIVNVGSCGSQQTIGDLAVSEVARAPALSFAKYLAATVAGDAIRVTTVLPGWVDGERMDSMLAEEAEARGVAVEQVVAENTAQIPAGRFATAEEIGDAVAFLASDRARYVTGTALRIDGGWCAAPTT